MSKFVTYVGLAVLAVAMSGCRLSSNRRPSDTFIPEMSNIDALERTNSYFFPFNDKFELSSNNLASINRLLKRTRAQGISNIGFIIMSNRVMPMKQQRIMNNKIATLMHEHGFIDSRIVNLGNAMYRGASAGVRINILRYIVNKTSSRKWTESIGDIDLTKDLPRMGASDNFNLESMIANEADLVSPRRYKGPRACAAISSIGGGGDGGGGGGEGGE